MFSSVRNRLLTRNIANFIFKNININKNLPQAALSTTFLTAQPSSNILVTAVRHKSKSRTNYKKRQQSDSEDESSSDDDDDDFVDKSTKIMTPKVNSLRLDGILKAGLGIARNKIEIMFYESRIRVNGDKVLKKSELVNEGDEIDVVKNVSPSNPKFLVVSRLEIVDIKSADDSVYVKMKRNRNLLIENYEVPWKPSASDSN